MDADWNGFQLPSLLVDVVQLCSSVSVQSKCTCQTTSQSPGRRGPAGPVPVQGCSRGVQGHAGVCRDMQGCSRSYTLYHQRLWFSEAQSSLQSPDPDGTADHLQLAVKNEDLKGEWAPLHFVSLTQILLLLFLNDFASAAFCQGHRDRRWTLLERPDHTCQELQGKGIGQDLLTKVASSDMTF